MRADLDHLPPPPRESLGQKATYWRYRAMWEAVARMPEPLARRLPARLGAAWYRLAPRRQREQVRRNLARVTGADSDALDEIVADAYVSYARYWIDAFRLHRMEASDVLARSTEENITVVDDLVADGGGGILATGHLGSWDIGALFTSQRNWKMTVVAEVLEPRRLFDRFVWLRRQAGIGVIPLVEGGDMIDRMVEAVESGGLATLLADRDLTRKGPIVEFFGEPCRLPPGTAVLARRTRRPVVVGAFVTQGDAGYRAVIAGDPFDISHLSVRDGMQHVASRLEDLIGRYPAQWHVFVRNWLAEREPEHPVVAAWQAGEDWRAVPDPARTA